MDPRPGNQVMRSQKIQLQAQITFFSQGRPGLEDGQQSTKARRKILAKLGRTISCTERGRQGSYRLERLSGEPLPNTWNISHLKFYFS